ncbi:MAG: T9SS type A sorting domain-containing protein, partial [Bacteroidota bacterium]
AGWTNPFEQAYVTKYDANGTPLWAADGGGSGNDNATGVAIDGHGNAYVTGYYSDTASFDGNLLTDGRGRALFLAKYDPNGNLLWVESAGSPTENFSCEATAVTVDDVGNCYVAGHYSQEAYFDGTNYSDLGVNGSVAFIAKYDNMGNFLWITRFDGMYGKGITDIALSADGTWLSILGNYTDFMNIENMLLDSAASYPNSLANTKFVAALDTSGQPLWVSRIADRLSNKSDLSGLALDDNGNAYITGILKWRLDFGGGTVISIDTTLSNTYWDIFTAKYNSNGDLQWARGYWTEDDSRGQAITLDAAGNPYIAGTYEGEMVLGNSTLLSGNPSLFIARLDTDGEPVWAHGAQSTITSTTAIVAPATDEVILTGDWISFVQFPPHNPTHAGLSDTYLLKYSRGGTSADGELPTGALTVFPNPATNQVWIEARDVNTKGMVVQLIDMTGKMVVHRPWSGTQMEISTDKLPDGIYMISVSGAAGRFTGRLAVQH